MQAAWRGRMGDLYAAIATGNIVRVRKFVTREPGLANAATETPPPLHWALYDNRPRVVRSTPSSSVSRATRLVIDPQTSSQSSAPGKGLPLAVPVGQEPRPLLHQPCRYNYKALLIIEIELITWLLSPHYTPLSERESSGP